MGISHFYMSHPCATMGIVIIEKLVYGGSGLSRNEGKVVMTPYVLAGEDVDVKVVKARKEFDEAAIDRIITPSPERIQAKCPYFTVCGGCNYQHTAYENQRTIKETVLREVLSRVGKVEAPASIGYIAGEPWEYRNRTQFHIDHGRIGFLEPGTHNVVDVEECAISSPKINEALCALRGIVKDRRFPRFLESIEFFSNESEVQLNVLKTHGNLHVARPFFDWCEKLINGAVSGPLTYSAIGEKFRVSHQSFFQVNRFLIPELVDAAIGNQEGEIAFDLYAGVGLFTLPLSRRFRKVTAVEMSRSGHSDLEANVATAHRRVDTIRNQTEMFLETVDAKPNFILADPPRAGLGKPVTKELIRIGAKHISIISCDPPTLARDIAALSLGGYAVEALTIVDLFPQTYHMETVTRLVRQ